MSTAISVLGGVGLFLLGMTVMTSGLKGMAGSALRTVLSKVAATPMSGVVWGAVVTLIVQSSSATTMTTMVVIAVVMMSSRRSRTIITSVPRVTRLARPIAEAGKHAR